MRSRVVICVLGVFLCGVFECSCRPEAETPDWRTTLKTIRNGIHRIDTYLNAALDLFGGYDGLCQYKCTDGIPSMTKCCNQHDRCYDTCGLEKPCESAVTLLFDAVMHLGCKPYLDSQRETCICQYELKKEL
ncbi:hypothetical protein CRUP_016929 [Coryphaenoides rupestris]|nr:hypothetical protein CRUP_016929 [Coryphaenoides rupestris]